MFRDLPDAFFTQDGVPTALLRAGEPRITHAAPATDLRARAQAPARRSFRPELLRVSPSN
jgi:hypothetical protein